MWRRWSLTRPISLPLTRSSIKNLGYRQTGPGRPISPADLLIRRGGVLNGRRGLFAVYDSERAVVQSAPGVLVGSIVGVVRGWKSFHTPLGAIGSTGGRWMSSLGGYRGNGDDDDDDDDERGGDGDEVEEAELLRGSGDDHDDDHDDNSEESDSVDGDNDEEEEDGESGSDEDSRMIGPRRRKLSDVGEDDDSNEGDDVSSVLSGVVPDIEADEEEEDPDTAPGGASNVDVDDLFDGAAPRAEIAETDENDDLDWDVDDFNPVSISAGGKSRSIKPARGATRSRRTLNDDDDDEDVDDDLDDLDDDDLDDDDDDVDDDDDDEDDDDDDTATSSGPAVLNLNALLGRRGPVADSAVSEAPATTPSTSTPSSPSSPPSSSSSSPTPSSTRVALIDPAPSFTPDQALTAQDSPTIKTSSSKPATATADEAPEPAPVEKTVKRRGPRRNVVKELLVQVDAEAEVNDVDGFWRHLIELPELSAQIEAAKQEEEGLDSPRRRGRPVGQIQAKPSDNAPGDRDRPTLGAYIAAAPQLSREYRRLGRRGRKRGATLSYFREATEGDPRAASLSVWTRMTDEIARRDGTLEEKDASDVGIVKSNVEIDDEMGDDPWMPTLVAGTDIEWYGPPAPQETIQTLEGRPLKLMEWMTLFPDRHPPVMQRAGAPDMLRWRSRRSSVLSDEQLENLMDTRDADDEAVAAATAAAGAIAAARGGTGTASDAISAAAAAAVAANTKIPGRRKRRRRGSMLVSDGSEDAAAVASEAAAAAEAAARAVAEGEGQAPAADGSTAEGLEGIWRRLESEDRLDMERELRSMLQLGDEKDDKPPKK